jgi:hypothetical protein
MESTMTVNPNGNANAYIPNAATVLFPGGAQQTNAMEGKHTLLQTTIATVLLPKTSINTPSRGTKKKPAYCKIAVYHLSCKTVCG